MPVDYDDARQLLSDIFTEAEDDLLRGSAPVISDQFRAYCDTLFRSSTQAYREVLLGCAVARIQDKSINVSQPYSDHGPNAFSGRTLDERAINPFLHEQRIPSSRGPYLSVFRRSVRFDPSIRAGLRDKVGFDALLGAIAFTQSVSQDTELLALLRYLLFRFAEIREASQVPVSRLQRISLEQYDVLISGLLTTPSGGRFPVLLVASTFNAIKEFFGLDWAISWQGINVSDMASGVGGDITIARGSQTIMAVEVTERPVDRSRVIATFNTKIAPAGIEDYLFFVKSLEIDPEARQQARQYFAQGHEVNFLDIKQWILMSLATMGNRGRVTFNRVLVSLLEGPEISRTLKVAWNEQIAKLTA